MRIMIIIVKDLFCDSRAEVDTQKETKIRLCSMQLRIDISLVSVKRDLSPLMTGDSFFCLIGLQDLIRDQNLIDRVQLP